MTRPRIFLALVSLLATGACAPNRGTLFEKSLAEARRAHHSGRFDQAAERFDDAARSARLSRDRAYARYESALARARAGDVARASRELRALANERPASAYAPQADYKAADLASRSDPEVGLAELEGVLVRWPDDAVAKVALARLLRHDDQGGPEHGLARLEALEPKVAGRAVEEDVAYARARRLADLDRLEPARAAFLRVAERWPYPKGGYFDDALFRASEVEEKLGRPLEAIALLERLLSFRESSTLIGSYERPMYVPALLRIAKVYEETLDDRARARAALHRLYLDFRTSDKRDDALWREADLWKKDNDEATACNRLASLANDFPDSRYVPCAVDRCPSVKRPARSRAPATCHAYLTR